MLNELRRYITARQLPAINDRFAQIYRLLQQTSHRDHLGVLATTRFA